jgi:integrase
MSVYRRGKTWWYKFQFAGQTVRESTKSNSRTLARDAEQARKRDLERAINRIKKRHAMPLFKLAAKQWLAGKTSLAPSSYKRYEQCVENLERQFAGRLVCDIEAEDIAEYQQKRLNAGVSNRTVNYEVSSLGGILKKFRVWGDLSEDVQSLKENHDAGRSLSRDDEESLLKAIQHNRTPALLPLFLFSVDTGMRASEVRALRQRDLRLVWSDGIVMSGDVIVPKSKTAAGTGRLIPLTQRVCGILTIWLSRFPNTGPDSYVFPRHKIGIAGDKQSPVIWSVDLTRPIGSWKTAWANARKVAKVRYRWHDLRHTFVSRLAENPDVSEETLRALAGHVSKQMLERYSHIRTQPKRKAIASLERDNPQSGFEANLAETGHKCGHNFKEEETSDDTNSLKTNGGPSRTRTYDQRIMSPPL